MQELVKALARGGQQPPRPIFMPLIFAAAAKVAGLSPQQFYTNPTKIANGLRQLQGPLRCDALVCYADQTLIAEALGAGVEWETGLPQITSPPLQLTPVEVTTLGRVPIMLEVVHRLRIVLRGRVALAVALPGLFTTVKYLTDPSATDGPSSVADSLAAAGGATLQAARAVCEAGADLILLVEAEPPPADNPVRSQWLAMIETICNVTRFHEALPVLLTIRRGVGEWPEIAAQGAIPCLPAAELAQLPETESLPEGPYGLALPVTGPSSLPAETVLRLQNQNCILITTAGNIPYEIEAKELRPLVANLRQAVRASGKLTG
ncbi:MAG: uroporphyrinogen decarboxylase family protein [Anaerolineae bacterium]